MIWDINCVKQEKPRQLAALFSPVRHKTDTAPASQPKLIPAALPVVDKYPASTAAIAEAFSDILHRVYLQPAGDSIAETGPRLTNRAAWPLTLHWDAPRTPTGRIAAARFAADMELHGPEGTTALHGVNEITLSFAHPRNALATLKILVDVMPDEIFHTDTLCIKRFDDEEAGALTNQMLAEAGNAYVDSIQRSWDLFGAQPQVLMHYVPPAACASFKDMLAHVYFNAAHAIQPGRALINLKKLENAIALDTRQPLPHGLAAHH